MTEHPTSSEDAGSQRSLRGGLMVCGTTSDAGKSSVVTGLCRLLARQGARVAPFKAQNMALNSWVTADGAEIGRAQAVQAMAAGVVAEAAMNPILLKPTGDRTSQVVVLGRPWAEMDAVAYHRAKPELFSVVLDALADLRSRFDVVLCEGAGSPAEINLLENDIVNLRLAKAAGFNAVVVGDIERGGVFAALYGTVSLLPDDLRPLVRGWAINKFRGDPSLLTSGIVELESRTRVPALGVLPMLDDLGFDAEDSLALDRGFVTSAHGSTGGWSNLGSCLDVAVIRFPRIANFTDFDALALEPAVTVRLVDSTETLGDPDLVILPGTKSTVADLDWLRTSGLASLITPRPGGPVVLGICGGYQMLGTRIVDPGSVESDCGDVDGLGWLPVKTVFEADKVTRRRKGEIHAASDSAVGDSAVGDSAVGLSTVRQPVGGYQIHHGRVFRCGVGEPWFDLIVYGEEKGSIDQEGVEGGGAREEEGMADVARGIYGTTLHGLFENDDLRVSFLAEVARRRGKRFEAGDVSFEDARQSRIDLLADACEEHLDMDVILGLIGEGVGG